MKLLDEIIELAAGDEGSVATLLRKCLRLAHTLRNDRLKAWAANELNGYGPDDSTVPEYRKTAAGAVGFFIGFGGAQLNNQPIPSAMLQAEHRHFADSLILHEPVASYEGVTAGSHFKVPWPANLTVVYQKSFFPGYVLNRAWQEIPGSVLVGLIDTIKTRVLSFALELQDDLGLVSDIVAELPKDKVDQQVTMYIFGGNNVIASRDFTHASNIEIKTGDWAGLAGALEKLGVQDPAIAELKSALDYDGKDQTTGLGHRTLAWLKQLGKASGHAAMEVGTEVAKKWILEYLGLKT